MKNKVNIVFRYNNATGMHIARALYPGTRLEYSYQASTRLEALTGLLTMLSGVESDEN